MKCFKMYDYLFKKRNPESERDRKLELEDPRCYLVFTVGGEYASLISKSEIIEYTKKNGQSAITKVYKIDKELPLPITTVDFEG